MQLRLDVETIISSAYSSFSSGKRNAVGLLVVSFIFYIFDQQRNRAEGIFYSSPLQSPFLLAKLYGPPDKLKNITTLKYLYFMDNTLENKRLENLYYYQILDTPTDGHFDEITSLTAKLFEVPIAIITLVDTDRIWFKSSFGLEVEQISRDPGLCSSAIMSDDIYIVENAKLDPRTLSNPLVAGIMGLQFYAAAPLKSKEGYNLGTLCIIDKNPRRLNAKESSILLHLSRIVVDQLELKLQSRLLIKDIQNRFN